MRKLVIGLTCLSVLSQPAVAQTAAEIILPSPITIAVIAGSWMFTGNKKVYYIEVKSRAATFEEARNQGFRLAVEHAVGSVVMSETEVDAGRIRRDEIINYASGFVDRYEIVEQKDVSNGVQLRMKVWVTHSKLAGRLLNTSETAGAIEGDRVAVQVSTIQHERQTADRMLTAVLKDYPQRAYDIQLEPTRVVLDQQRQPQLYLTFKMSMNRQYLDSLSEAVTRSNQRRDCERIMYRCDARNTVEVVTSGIFSSPKAWFDDDQSWQIFLREAIQTKPAVRVTFLDSSSRVQHRMCVYVPEIDHHKYSPWQFVEVGPGRVTVNGTRSKRVDGFIPMGNLPVRNFDRVELQVVRGSQC